MAVIEAGLCAEALIAAPATAITFAALITLSDDGGEGGEKALVLLYIIEILDAQRRTREGNNG